MQICLMPNEFWITPCLREYVVTKVQLAFSVMKSRTVSISVRLRELGAQKDGCDMMCQISVSMPGLPEVLVRYVQEDMYAAIDMAVKRAAHRAQRIMMCRRAKLLKAVRMKMRINR